jgi:hypothetical protein
MLMNHLSYASRPSRIFIRSDDAIDRAGTGTPSNFVLPLIENILDCKAVQLLSCRIPNALPQIPDYQRYFIYSAGGQLRAFMIDHNVLYSQRYYADYTALAAQLTIDAAYWIPYTGTQLNRASFMAAVAQPPDVSFAVDPVTRKILMTNISGVPIQLGSELDFQNIIVPAEVVKNYLYLNFLLGYETRPAVIATLPPLAPAAVYTPPSWANLVPTQTIYIRSNLVMNGTYTSNGTRNILQTIPVLVPSLGIINYQSSQRHYIYSVPSTIGTITIELLDDNGQPIFLPENAQTEFEVGCIYEDEI